ncbi:hypothetical protein STEG23_004724, partial [Scotinomys teguina]
MARKAGQGKEEEESRARQQGEKTPACDGRGHHVVEQDRFPVSAFELHQTLWAEKHYCINIQT